MADPKKSVDDDYYARAGSSGSGTDAEAQKKPARLKIIKKVAESREEEPAPSVPSSPAPAAPAESPAAKPETKQARPVISFEAAPERAVRADAAVQRENRPVRPAGMPNRVQQAARPIVRPADNRPSRPAESAPAGPRPRFELPERQQKRGNTRPVISFEAAPEPQQVARTVRPETTEAASGRFGLTSESKESRLKSYAKRKSEAPARPVTEAGPDRGRRSGSRSGYSPEASGLRDDGGFRRAKKSGGQHSNAKKKEKNVEDIQQVLVDRTGQEVKIPDVLTVKELSEKLGTPMAKVMVELVKNGMLVNLNTRIDFDTSFLVGSSFGITVVRAEQAGVSSMSILDGDIRDLVKEDDLSRLRERAPVISIMGHVDHGKTSILDHIRSSTVAASEEGGITQKIGAYQVDKNGRKITFLDTPGHAAFGLMRSRGSKLTDIIIIVVAADEGVKPQTIESIELAKAAEVPIIVAVNKMDKEGANPDLVKGQLAEHGLTPEEWGGSTIMVPVSAKTGLGMDTLLDMILLVADMRELKANPDRSAVATVVEARLDPKLGHVATILVNTGTLRKGDAFVVGSCHGRIRSLRDFRNKNIDSAGPSSPAIITGMSAPVEGGDILQVVADIATAEQKAHEFGMLKATKSIRTFEGASLDTLLGRLKSGNLKHLKMVIKAESNGSLEALRGALLNLSTAETQVTIIHAGVGDFNENDVYMAGMGQALLVGYNVGVNPQARQTLEDSKIECINKKVIYHILEKIEAIITGMIDIRFDDVDIGTAKIKAIFYSGKERLIVGVGVESGHVDARAKVRIIRDGRKIGMGEIANVKRGPLDVPSVSEGDECGLNLKTDVKVQEGDILEAYALVQRK